MKKRFIASVISGIMMFGMLFNTESSVKAYPDINNQKEVTEQTNVNQNFENQEGYDVVVDKFEQYGTEHKQSFALKNVVQVSEKQAAGAVSAKQINNIAIFITFTGNEQNNEYAGNVLEVKQLYNGGGTQNSLKEYMNKISYGKLTMNTVFSADQKQDNKIFLYKSPKPEKYYMPYDAVTNPIGYGDKLEGADHTEHDCTQLMVDAFNSVKAQLPSELDYDFNNDNYIDSVQFYVPNNYGKYDDKGNCVFLWSHRWCVKNPSQAQYNGAKLNDYNLINYNAISNEDYGTVAHEFLHIVGFPDLYQSIGSQDIFTTMGAWSIMSNTPANLYPTVYERMKYGQWIDESRIKQVKENKDYTIYNSQSNPNNNTIAYKIPSGKNGEYFMIEYRNKSGYDSSIVESGMIVYRVVENRTGNGGASGPELTVLSNNGSYKASLTSASSQKSIKLIREEGTDTGYTVSYVSSTNNTATFSVKGLPKPIVVSGFSVGNNKLNLGETVNLSTSASGGEGTLKYKYTYTLNGKETTIRDYTTVNNFNWTPSTTGSYTLKTYVTDGITTESKSYSYVVVSKPQTQTKATIYYNKKSNLTGSNVYIHYNKNGQGWTSVPGKLMTSTSEQSGYKYKFEIDLEKANGKLVYCFNDGNNHWDSRNGANYECTVGTYGVSNEQQKAIDTKFAVTALNTTFSQCTINGTVGITAVTSNASGTVSYKFIAIDSNGNEKVIKDYSTESTTTWRPTATGKYTLRVDAIDANNKVVSKTKSFNVVSLPTGTGTFDKQSPQSLGSTIKVNVNGTGGTGTLQYQLIAQGGNYQFGGREIYVQKFSTNKSISWTPEVDGDYGLMLDIKDETGAINRVSLGHYIISKDFAISSFTTDIASPQAAGKTITLKADAKNATGTVQYQFTAQKSGSSASVIQAYSTKNTCYWYPGSQGTYTLTVSAKDSTGKVVTKTMSYEIKTSVGITSVSVDKQSPQEVNTTINIKVNTQGGIGTVQYRYSFLSWNGVKTILKDYSTSNTFAWTPQETMVGFLYVEAKDAAGNSPSTYQMDYSITPATVKMTTIYYKGYSNPYIHYKVGNGSWTTAPGVKMSSNSEVNGYDYSITINLGQAEKLTACFNNGSGAWDSNNGNNYTFGAGYYTFSNGVITKINKPEPQKLNIASVVGENVSIDEATNTITYYYDTEGKLKVNVAGGSGSYVYELQLTYT